MSEIDAMTDVMTNSMAYAAARSTVAIHNQGHWGRISVGDEHRLDFLHNQSTNGFKLLQPGAVCDTTFLTSTARTLDLTTALILEDQVQLLVSPGMADKLIAFLDRFIFFSDRVKLTDISTTTTAFCLIGPNVGTMLKNFGIELPESGYIDATIVNISVKVIAGTGLGLSGCRLLLAIEGAAEVWKALSNHAAVMNDSVYDRLRIEQGRPMPGFELTEDYNPLDAGLWNTISFNKGCYIGQETIARLDAYNGVKLNLWGLTLEQPVELGTSVMDEDKKIGTITSLHTLEDGSAIALAYVKTKAGGSGLNVTVESQTTVLKELPFPVREKIV